MRILDEFVPMVSKVKLTSYHEFVGSAFLGSNYVTNTKENLQNKVERTFDFKKSVFKDWKRDKEKVI